MKGILLIVFVFFQIMSVMAITDTISGHRIDEVTVTTSVIPVVSGSAVPVQLVTEKEMVRIGAQSLADVVRRFAGVTVKDYGGIGGMKTVSFRGLDAQHTGISYDGIGVGEAQSGQVDIGRFSLENISMVSFSITQPDDILQSARYYSSSAVLNIKTGQPFFEDNPYKAKVSAKTGSFGYFAPSVYYLRKLNANWSASINGEWQRADGNYPFDFSDGAQKEKRKRRNSDVNIFRTEANVYGDLKKGGKLNLKANYYDTERGLPGAVINNNPYSSERLADKDFFMQSRYDNDINDKISVQGLAKFSRYYKKYTDRSINDSRFLQFEYYASTAALYKLTDQVSFSFAQDYIRNALNMNYYVNKVEVSDNALTWNKAYRNSYYSALNAKYKNNRLTVMANLLYGYFNENALRGENPPDKNRLSPAFSVIYKPFDTPFRIRFSYKDIYRVPTINDLYYSQTGNTRLKPEITKQWNVGVVWTGDFDGFFNYLRFSADGYLNKVKDKIVPHNVSMFYWKMMNVDNVAVKGFDLNFSAKKKLTNEVNMFFNGNYSYRYAENEDAGYRLTYTPRHTGSGSVGMENPWLNVSYSIICSDKTYFSYPFNSLTRIDKFADHSVSVNKTVFFSGSSLLLQADLLNLTDDNYQIMKNYPMPGRNFRISATWNF